MPDSSSSLTGRCHTCAHWTEEDGSLTPGDYGAGLCAKLTGRYEANPPHGFTGFTATNEGGSGPGVTVYEDSDPIQTSSDFGCVLWRARPSNPPPCWTKEFPTERGFYWYREWRIKLIGPSGQKMGEPFVKIAEVESVEPFRVAFMGDELGAGPDDLDGEFWTEKLNPPN